MFEWIGYLFSYSFISRAIIVGVLASLCASLLGVSLVLKNYSMIGDGLSHVAFGALSLSVVLGTTPLLFSIPIVIIAAYFLLRISNSNSRLNSDAAIAIISSSALAIGVLVTALTSGMGPDVNNYLFGSILAMSQQDAVISIIVSVLVLILFILFYRKIFAITFDENFAKAVGIKTGIINTILALLTAVTIVIGMRIMGAMLISSLIIFPALTAMQIFRSYKSVTVASAVISVFAFLLGMIASYSLSTPAGASIVVVNLILFLIALAVGKIKGSSGKRTI